jgi:hypothetical protein
VKLLESIRSLFDRPSSLQSKAFENISNKKNRSTPFCAPPHPLTFKDSLQTKTSENISNKKAVRSTIFATAPSHIQRVITNQNLSKYFK